jgi:hypothetical protein
MTIMGFRRSARKNIWAHSKKRQKDIIQHMYYWYSSPAD